MSDDAMTWGYITSISPLLVANVAMEAVYCYVGVYWLLPKFLAKENYIALVVGLSSIAILCISLFSLLFIWFLEMFTFDAFLDRLLKCAYIFATSGAFPIFILLISWKMLKTWNQKEIEKSALVIGNTKAELSLLKAQVHPHFLFNTLNNIYSYTLDQSPLAGELVVKLSHILRYMTKECNQPLVKLSKEIIILTDYMGLEKVRYGNRLDLQIEINGDAENKLIAPLLMIPFIENSFKHGPSKMLQYAWIKLTINIRNDQLLFKLSNSKALTPVTNGKNGLGLNNVKRRLKLLYPNSHFLDIKSENDIFTVEMVVQLEHSGVTINMADNSSITPKILSQSAVYARI